MIPISSLKASTFRKALLLQDVTVRKVAFYGFSPNAAYHGQILDFRKTCLFCTKFLFATRRLSQNVAVRKTLLFAKVAFREEVVRTCAFLAAVVKQYFSQNVIFRKKSLFARKSFVARKHAQLPAKQFSTSLYTKTNPEPPKAFYLI